MKFMRIERFAFLLLGFLPGVIVGVLTVIVYANANHGIVRLGPNAIGLQDWMHTFEAPPTNYWWNAISYEDTAIHVPLHQIVLVRSQETLGAIRFTSFDFMHDTAIGHLWLLKQNEDDGPLVVEYDRAFTVWEVREVVGQKTVDGVQQADVRYAGGALKIGLGDLSIEWSQSTWLYFQPGVNFALLDVVDIEDVTIELFDSIRTGEPSS